MDFEQKRKLKKFLYSRTMLVILLLIVLGISRATWNVYQKMQLSKANLEIVTKDLDKLKERQTALASQIDRLNTEQGVESEIRQKFKVVKEGEGIAVIVNDDIKLPAVATTTDKGLWQKFLGIFTNNQ